MLLRLSHDVSGGEKRRKIVDFIEASSSCPVVCKVLEVLMKSKVHFNAKFGLNVRCRVELLLDVHQIDPMVAEVIYILNHFCEIKGF